MGSELYRYRNIGEITNLIKALNSAVGKPENRAIGIHQTAVLIKGISRGGTRVNLRDCAERAERTD
jgi:hypothetical protein